MSGAADDAKALRGEVLSADQVEAWLTRHAEFLNERPELLAMLVPPEFHRGDQVVDMQHFMLQRLRGQIAQMKSREQTLLAAAEANVAVQARVHHAVKALMAARSFEHLIRVVVDELPGMLDVAAVALAVENGERLPGAAGDTGVVTLKPGAIDRLLGADRTIALRATADGDTAVFRDRVAQVRSVAMLRLTFGPEAPAGLFALGSAAAGGFDPRQGTELLSFLAHVLQLCIRRWLGLAS
jgi:hypothetical protein